MTLMRTLVTLAATVLALASSAPVRAGADLAVGDVAPAFTLEASDVRTYSLADFPLLSDPDKSVGRDGRILAIDKAVKPATSAQDMAAKLGELGAPAK
jgi:hypothetical protein